MQFLSKKIALFLLALSCTACATATPYPQPSLTNDPSAALTETASIPREPSVAPSPSPLPPTLPPAPRRFNEPFSSKPQYWAFLQVDQGQHYLGPTVQDGFLLFDLPGPNQWVYAFYGGPQYEDVFIETEYQIRTSGDGSAGLVCRYDEKKGWYEFDVFADQTYQLLFGQWLAPGVARYAPLYQGKSPAIHSDTNRIGLQCQGNALEGSINGTPLPKRPELKYGLQKGQVGLAVSSFADFPYMIAFDWVQVSEP